MIRYTNKLQIVPLQVPTNASTVAGVGNASARVRLRNLQWLSFLINWGTVTESTSVLNVTVWSSTNQTSTNANDTAIPFKYRLSSAVGTDGWGAIVTPVRTDGSVLVTGIDGAGRAMIVDVDPADIPALDSDALYAYVRIIGGAAATDIQNVAITGIFEPRYPQSANLTSS
jgi:hypothetical protein